MMFAVERAPRQSAGKPAARGAAVALGLVLALSLAAGEARAQSVCTPTQTVSDTPDADGRYTTTLVCADVSGVEGVADYRHLHHNQDYYKETYSVSGVQTDYMSGGAILDNPADRDTSLANNLANNNLALTIGRGVVFQTATGNQDMRVLDRDGAIVLWTGGAKTLVIEDGARIDFLRTPGVGVGTYIFDASKVYPHWFDLYRRQDSVFLQSKTSTGGGISVSHGGIINNGIQQFEGFRYTSNEGAAIHARIVDDIVGETRADDDISIHMTSTGVIRQLNGSHSLGGVTADNAGEDGDITIRLDKGSRIDLGVAGGIAGVRAAIRSVWQQAARTGSIAVYAGGTIRNVLAQPNLVLMGMGIQTINQGTGDTRIESSGSLEAVHGHAIFAQADSTASEQRDDPATPQIEGNVIDVTSGTVLARGHVAISASTTGGDTWTVRVAEGATVRAEFDAGPGALPESIFQHSSRGWDGNNYARPNSARGWRQVDRNNDGTVDGLEPLVNAIAIGRANDTAAGAADHVIVHGTVQTVGGGHDDAAIYFLRGDAAVTVGPTGKVISSTGVAIVSGCRPFAPPECLAGRTSGSQRVFPGSDWEPATRDLSVTVARGGEVDGDIRVVDNGDLTVTLAGAINGDIRTEGGGDLAVTVVEGGRIASSAMHTAAGDLDLTVDRGGTVTGDLRPPRHGALTLAVLEGGVVPGTVYNPAALTVAGRVGRAVYSNGGKVTVAATGALTGVREGGRTEALRADAGTLDVTVAGRVAGDLRPPSGGALKLSIPEGGVVSGTVRDPEGPLTVAGSIGRLLYSNGGTVTVTETGRLTGVREGGRTEALRSDSGDLDVTVAGRVAGDLRPPTGGTLKLSIPEGGVVSGTVRDPEGPLEVAGSIGRLLYSNGGKVTVAATGALTGVREGGGIEALRSDSGDLDVTVAGRVAGDLRPPTGGALKLSVLEGGVVSGTVRDPEGPLEVAGSIGRLLYSNGATVTVTETGRLTGVETDSGTEALRSVTGDLYMTVAGTVTGDIYGLGAGEHDVIVAPGGTVTGVIHLAASTAQVDGSAGAVFLDRGGEVAVGRGGRITGVDGVGIRSASGDFTGTVRGTVVGDIYVLGSGDRRVAVRSGGEVTGNVYVPNGDSAGAARVEVAQDARVAGVVRVPVAENLELNGEVGAVDTARGGVLTVGATGRVTGTGDAPDVSSETGDLTVVVRVARGETEADAMRRAPSRVEAKSGAEQVLYQLPGSDYLRRLGAFDTGGATIPSGPFDIGVIANEHGIRIVETHAPRARVYEALPSVLLSLRELSGAGAWMEAPRLSNDMRAQMASVADTAPTPRLSNGMWARTQAFGGARDAKQSTSGPISLKYRGWGMEAGMDIPLADGALMSVSAHRRSLSADVSGDAGDINIVGNGLAASLAADLADRVAEGVYAGARVSATSYSARLSSGPRGTLQRDADGLGHTVSLEAGRRMAWGQSDSLGEVTLTPRARLLYSRVDMDAFTDSVGARVSLKDGVARTARAGLLVRALDRPAGSMLFGSVDVEREFEPETRVRVSGYDLKSESETTRVRVELGGAIGWGEGAYALQAAARYASGADDYGGGVSLRVRF